ncbi:hypothetical protein F5Y12DRAFT_796427 [Xylaria sp. FL1777]|nr:hypothetical protein F5Y12DRAFT_796427 [Xylaria sp. FL1777]
MAASNNSGSVLRHRIEDFGLVRESTEWEARDTAFIDPYLTRASLDESSHSSSSLPTIPEWSTFKITLPYSTLSSTSSRDSGSPRLLNGYAVSPSHHAYVTFAIYLTISGAGRLTPMRYRDMIADNYISACVSTSSSLSQLRWMGVANILNETSRATFQRVYELTGHDILSRGAVEIEPEIHLREDFPNHQAFRDLLVNDPFTRGVLALLHHHAEAMSHASVKRFVFVSEGFESSAYCTSPSPLELRLNLIVELARCGDSAPVPSPEEALAYS